MGLPKNKASLNKKKSQSLHGQNPIRKSHLLGLGMKLSRVLSTFELPFYAYLLASAVTAIAAIGSVFEYINQKPVFGVLESDSIFYAPVLGFFAFTGIPTSGYLWFKSVQTANKETEEQDCRDGYR